MMTRHLTFFLVTTMGMAYQQDCGRSANSESRPNQNNTILRGPDERSAIVFFFKKDVAVNDQTKFLDEVLSIQLDYNRGRDFLPGMKSTFGVRVQGFEGFAINFLRGSTEEQKIEVIRRLQESPLVYKIYRNAVPNEIDDL